MNPSEGTADVMRARTARIDGVLLPALIVASGATGVSLRELTAQGMRTVDADVSTLVMLHEWEVRIAGGLVMAISHPGRVWWTGPDPLTLAAERFPFSPQVARLGSMNAARSNRNTAVLVVPPHTLTYSDIDGDLAIHDAAAAGHLIGGIIPWRGTLTPGPA